MTGEVVGVGEGVQKRPEGDKATAAIGNPNSELC